MWKTKYGNYYPFHSTHLHWDINPHILLLQSSLNLISSNSKTSIAHQHTSQKYRPRVTAIIPTLIKLCFLAILSLLLIVSHPPNSNTWPFNSFKPNFDSDSASRSKSAPGKLGAVASENSICSQHGVDILRKGGNAADAVSAGLRAGRELLVTIAADAIA